MLSGYQLDLKGSLIVCPHAKDEVTIKKQMSGNLMGMTGLF
jgi:hypothetical protein